MKAFSAWLEAANLPAELMMPASEGAETLVPPRTNHLWRLPSNRLVSRTQTPVLGFASNEKSGVPRKSPTISAMRSWKCGRASTWLGPPPASCQVFSRRNVPEFGSLERVVPPAEITFGEVLGQPAPGLSPEEAMYTTPGVVKYPSCFVSVRNSPEPQLMETSPPPFVATRFEATSTAWNRSRNLFEFASTKQILALGAMA